jgi:hypothetical protein
VAIIHGPSARFSLLDRQTGEAVIQTDYPAPPFDPDAAPLDRPPQRDPDDPDQQPEVPAEGGPEE